MVVVEDTRENRSVRNVVATMAIEGMYFDEDGIRQEGWKDVEGSKTGSGSNQGRLYF